jgi:hypothetical protein
MTDDGPLVSSAWDRHHKRSRFETRDMVISMLMAMNLDCERFERNHAAYCEYWDFHGWQYNPETLLAWVRNGMCPPPPEAGRIVSRQPVAARAATEQPGVPGCPMCAGRGWFTDVERAITLICKCVTRKENAA